jgi:EpsI family protein
VATFDVLAEKLELGAQQGAAMIKLCVALAFLGFNFYTYHYLATDPVFPDRERFEDFPDQLGNWSCPEREKMGDAILTNLGVSDYLLCNFENPDFSGIVGVYVGYHVSQIREEGGGPGGNPIHPPAHCLPGSGWDIIDNRLVELDLPGLPQAPATVRRLVIARGDHRQLVYYWYQGRGRVVSQDWQKILYVGFDRAVRSRTDGSLVRFTVPILHKDEATAEASFYELAPSILALLPAYVPE